MSKAELRAFEIYPKMSRITEPHGIIPADYKSHYIGDANEEKRIGFIEGYHQAKKDNELTWEDVRRIYLIVNSTINDVGMDNLTDKSIYQEVLKRFNKVRKEK